MKKTLSVLLTILMLTGFAGIVASANGDDWAYNESNWSSDEPYIVDFSVQQNGVLAVDFGTCVLRGRGRLLPQVTPENFTITAQFSDGSTKTLTQWYGVRLYEWVGGGGWSGGLSQAWAIQYRFDYRINSIVFVYNHSRNTAFPSFDCIDVPRFILPIPENFIELYIAAQASIPTLEYNINTEGPTQRHSIFRYVGNGATPAIETNQGDFIFLLVCGKTFQQSPETMWTTAGHRPATMPIFPSQTNYLFITPFIEDTPGSFTIISPAAPDDCCCDSSINTLSFWARIWNFILRWVFFGWLWM